ncbi:MAG: UbiA family prenyltransferase [Planctomycetes bacterium]|nr:UbiA family prenyltransferase [Planctomycetota bacterium]
MSPADYPPPPGGSTAATEPLRPPAAARGRSLLESVKTFGEMIKISHSVFALPFAVAAFFVAAGGAPDWLLFLKVVLACVFARTAAMSFNRWADASIDARNPRTRGRALPAGQLHRGAVLAASAASAALFIATAFWINSLAFRLSPAALLVLLGYSYTKRFTSASHLALGLALGLSPLGAWVAARNELALFPALLGLAVLFWTAGFDIIYACQDLDFDRREKLLSIPARCGIARALWISRLFHLLTLGLLAVCGWIAGLGPAYFSGIMIVGALLLYEQWVVRGDDLTRVNVAFFNLNGLISVIYMTATLIDLFLFKRQP